MFGPILTNLGGQVTNSQVDNLLIVSLVQHEGHFGQNTGGNGFWDRRQNSKNGGQLTNTPQRVKVDNLLAVNQRSISGPQFEGFRINKWSASQGR